LTLNFVRIADDVAPEPSWIHFDSATRKKSALWAWRPISFGMVRVFRGGKSGAALRRSLAFCRGPCGRPDLAVCVAGQLQPFPTSIRNQRRRMVFMVWGGASPGSEPFNQICAGRV